MSTVALCVYCEQLPEKNRGPAARAMRCPLCKTELGITPGGGKFRIGAKDARPRSLRTGFIVGAVFVIAGCTATLGNFLWSRNAARPIEMRAAAPEEPASITAALGSEAPIPLPAATAQPNGVAAKPYLRGNPGRSKQTPYSGKLPAETPRFAASARALPPSKTILFDESIARELYKLLDNHVPEVSLQPAPPKNISKNDARERIIEQTKLMREHNQKGQNGFVRMLNKDRADLAGLPFLLGDDCRRDERSAVLVAEAAQLIRNPRAAFSTSVALIDRISQSGKRTTEAVRATEHTDERVDIARFLEAWNYASSKESPANARQRQAAGIAALTQILSVTDRETRCDLIEQLAMVDHPVAGRALVRFALFDLEREVRAAAIQGLHGRKSGEILEPLLAGFRHPWPAAALHAGQALVALELVDAVPRLIDCLDEPDPAAPIMVKTHGKEVPAIRELVRTNHLRNCQLCHDAADERVILQAQVPSAAEPLPRSFAFVYCGDRRQLDVAVRPDVTHLRQDFSLMQEVADAGTWPKVQRFDFLVRNRFLTAAEIAERKRNPAHSLQREFMLATLRVLTWQDHGANAAAWRSAVLAKPSNP